MKIATFNIRYADAPNDGENRWENRRQFVADWINKYAPAAVGIQEVLPRVREELISLLPGYYILGAARESEYTGEASPIALRKDLLEPLEVYNIWLSPRPFTVNSRFSGNDGHARICTNILARDKQSGKIIRLLNTHLDCMYPEIRSKQLAVIENFYLNHWTKYPTILTGDFNAEPNELAPFIKSCGFIDLTTPEDIDTEYTYHDFFRTDDQKKIDYILVSPDIDVTKTWCDKSTEPMLSDHFPIISNVQI